MTSYTINITGALTNGGNIKMKKHNPEDLRKANPSPTAGLRLLVLWCHSSSLKFLNHVLCSPTSPRLSISHRPAGHVLESHKDLIAWDSLSKRMAGRPSTDSAPLSSSITGQEFHVFLRLAGTKQECEHTDIAFRASKGWLQHCKGTLSWQKNLWPSQFRKPLATSLTS